MTTAVLTPTPLPRLLTAAGGPRYAAALAVDALGTGLLRPFLLLYGMRVLHLGVAETGAAMSVGMVLGLAAVPLAGRWIDRGGRTAVVAAAMAVRALGVLPLLAARPGGGALPAFVLASLLLGTGNQCWAPAHAALVTALAPARDRDAALAAGRSLRNAGLGLGALLAALGTTGGTGALRTMAAATALGYALAGALAWSLRTTAARRPQTVRTGGARPTVLDLANLPYAFCFNVLEVALPAVLVTQLHAAPAWSAAVFVGNTVLVVTGQVAVVRWLSRYSRHTALAAAGALLALSYLGFWAAGSLGGRGAAAAVAVVSVLLTAGEIGYTGTATALVIATTEPERLGRALARFQLSSGIGVALSPAVLTALYACGPAALWLSLAAVTLLGAAAVKRTQPLT
ncbi:MFS transporter [Kitasatospora sp. NPDC002227]|uniref:MFS transporter n=1 Tax=Kitasatospora sp. NPDC002227 TaxID=3154773 RepID=UPI00331F0580